jgi:pimeloyl-ACP methyl ester carboxylesterase
MGTITTKDGTEIYYKDWGKGQPIVFSHGWPLSADDWDTQMLFFLKHGYRVIAHDRRGHGRSSQVRPRQSSRRTLLEKNSVDQGPVMGTVHSPIEPRITYWRQGKQGDLRWRSLA